jgi:Ca-activated chloride channel family protein
MGISMLRFDDPWLLLSAALPVFLWLLERHSIRAGLPLSSCGWVSPTHAGGFPSNLKTPLRVAAMLCLAPLVAGLTVTEKHVAQEIPALVVVLDNSSSMTAEDFSPANRLRAAKENLKKFAMANPGLQLGVVTFAGSSTLVVPLTGDHDTVVRAVDLIRPATYEEDGTAIGTGLASAVNRLKEGPWTSRKILLITDGVSNRGAVSPVDAAKIATLLGITIDTVGIGTDAVSRFWAPSPDGLPAELKARIEIDDEALSAISRSTGGHYTRARSAEQLRAALEAAASRMPRPVVPDEQRGAPPWIRLLAGTATVLLLAEFALAHFLASHLPG